MIAFVVACAGPPSKEQPSAGPTDLAVAAMENRATLDVTAGVVRFADALEAMRTPGTSEGRPTDTMPIRDSNQVNSDPDWMPREWRATIARNQAVAMHAVSPLPLAPGDISIHHCLTLHGSPSNTSDRPRRTILLRMFDAACTLVPSKLPPGAEAFFATDADGHLSAAGFPIVHE